MRTNNVKVFISITRTKGSKLLPGTACKTCIQIVKENANYRETFRYKTKRIRLSIRNELSTFSSVKQTHII